MDSEFDQVDKNGRKFGQIYFFFLGISSLIGWNAVLTSLDFFNMKYGEIADVYFFFPIPYFIAGSIMCILLKFLADKISMYKRLTYGFIAYMIFIILLVVFAQLIVGPAGYAIANVIILAIGASNQFGQTSGIAFAGAFTHDNYIPTFFSGSGIAGVSLCVIRLIILGALGDSPAATNTGTVIFFIIAALIIIFTLFLNQKFFMTPYCKYHISLISNVKDVKQEQLLDEEGENSQVEIKKKTLGEEISEMVIVFKKISPHPVLCWFIYTVTFMLFPGVSISQVVIDELTPAFKVTLLSLIYNIYDTCGKYIANIPGFTDKMAIYFTCSRVVFYFFFIMLVKTTIFWLGSKWWVFICMGLFALSNGYCTSITMVLGPLKVQNNQKETAGFLMGFSLIFGIFSGSVLALMFQNM